MKTSRPNDRMAGVRRVSNTNQLTSMGLFDELTSKYPLPLDGANALLFQTKDTPAQWMDKYELRVDGTLWHESYDIEDRSDKGIWMREHPGETPPEKLDGFIGCMGRANPRWEQCLFTGEVRFGHYDSKSTRSITFSSYFVKGQLRELHLIEDEVLAGRATDGSAVENGADTVQDRSAKAK